MLTMVVTGLLAGGAMGVVLHRGQLCFHSMFTGAHQGRSGLVGGWLLGVGIGSVGLAVLYLVPWSAGLNRGLPFRPVANISGGLLVGVGMVVAQSCVSGLLYKLGSGMLGAVVGLVGWGVGELAVRNVDVPGPTVLPAGVDGTFAGLFDVPRTLLAAILLAAITWWFRRWVTPDPDAPAWQLAPRTMGLALGGVIVFGWLMARSGGVSYGPSSVGAWASVAIGSPRWWLIAFLLGIVMGGLASARSGADWWVRGEDLGRLVRLFIGGILIGAGGWIGGGCNLGHGLSGVSQLNVASWVAVVSMAVGVRLAMLVGRVSGQRLPASRAGA